MGAKIKMIKCPFCGNKIKWIKGSKEAACNNCDGFCILKKRISKTKALFTFAYFPLMFDETVDLKPEEI